MKLFLILFILLWELNCSAFEFDCVPYEGETAYFDPQDVGWYVYYQDLKNYLWLFADTLLGEITIANGTLYRNWTTMVHSSLAFVNLSESYDPSYWWRTTDGFIEDMGVFSPQNPTTESEYYWPVAGIVSSTGKLIVLAVTVVNVGEGFAVLGTDVIIVDDFHKPPQFWNYTTSRITWSNSTLTWQLGITIIDDFVYLMGCNQQQDGQPVVLSRISEKDFLQFNWNEMQFWSSDQLWTSLCADLMPLYDGPYTESTLFYNAYMEKWFMPLLSVYNNEIEPDYDIYIATSDTLTGIWTKQTIYSVPYPYDDATRVKIIFKVILTPGKYWNYAAKAHMEYSTEEDQIVLTFNTNSVNIDDLHYDLSIYHPLFINVTIE